MFSKLRSYLSYANIIATLALVFAMSGGAMAARHYLLSSTSQISPKVLKALKGKPGAAGPAGAQGAVGAQGPAGAQGPQGAKGDTGPAGAAGAQGDPGPAGREGSPWTAGGMLPSGKSETGVWGMAGPDEEFEGQGFVVASFTFPLSAPPTLVVIGPEQGEGEPEENHRSKRINEEREAKGEAPLPLAIPNDCKGNASKPEAMPGNLCVFVQNAVNANWATLLPESGPNMFLSTTGLTMQGVRIPEKSSAFSIDGSWAVTAS
jgi:Collagen triple helix repeat (20 copies)